MADTAAPVALFKRRGGKGNFRKRPATPPPESDHESGDDFESSEDEAGQRVKRRKRNAGTVTASSKNGAQRTDDVSTTTVFTADRNASLKSSNDATKTADWYDQPGNTDDLSAKKLLGSTRNISKPAAPVADGTYKGLANQTNFIQTNPDAPSRKVGPVKAPANIRTITVMDYKPDVCKDYKQTGHCGFGDSCIYLHDRTDYKQGWQLDKEWEEVTKGKKILGGTVVASADRKKAAQDDNVTHEEEEAMLENIPFACIICKEDYKSPIVTRCGHYFCERCALQRYRKNPSCAACGAGTNGVFNGAKKLQKLLDRKKEREAKRRQEALDAGEEVSEEEQDQALPPTVAA
jgi:RING finger protein 113A